VTNSRCKKEVLVVVHDAGGAEVIGAYVRANSSRTDFLCYGAGPAIKIFRRLTVPLKKIGAHRVALNALMRRHRDVSFALIAAPGWMTKMEINALEAAKRAGLKTVVYMDSWTDERRRFGAPTRGWQKRLPGWFWAGDTYAVERLRRQFPDIPVSFVANQYFKNEIRLFRAQKHSSRKTSVLFLSNIGPHSQTLFRALLDRLAQHGNDTHVLIRFHPADQRMRYDDLIAEARKRGVMVKKSRERELVRDLAHARAVIGTETMAMVIAILCGVCTVNFVPRNTRSILPHTSIRKVRSATKAAALALKN
jgi:hypothetical protein